MSTFQAPERSLPSFRSKAGIWLFWLGLTVLYLTLIYRQVQRPIWYDELITLFIARAPGISHFFHLLYKWDLTPPALHLLARASIAIFGANRVGVRLPSILAFYLASLLSFIYAKRKLGPSYAAMPVLLLWYSPFFQYATEARPYALVLLSFSTLLLSWDSVINAPEDRRSLGGVAIGSAGLVLSQVFAVLSLLPFLVDTVTWSKPRKSAFRLWAALLLPLIGVACYVPFFGGYESLFFPVRFQASLRKAAALFWHALSGLPILILLAVSLIALLWRVRTTGIKLFAFRRIDVFLFATLLSLPFVLNFVLSLRHGAFWDRYCITTVLGFYIVLAAFLKLSWNSAWAGCLITAALSLLILSNRVSHPVYDNLTAAGPSSPSRALAEVDPALPLVAASGLTFVEMNHDEDSSVLSRLYYLTDPDASVRYAHTNLFESLDSLRRDFGLSGVVEPYSMFIRQHSRFLVLGTVGYPEDWLLDKLAADHAKISRIGSYDLPYKDTTLYTVTITP